jgi:hypothetical protein
VVATLHIQDADFDSYLRNRAGSTVASRIQSHVRQFVTCEEKLVSLMIAQLAELSDKQRGRSSDQRLDRRLQTGEFGSLQTLLPLSFQRSDVEVINISRNGFGLLTTTFLQPGTIVQMTAGTTVKLGEVRYCRSVDGGRFHTGVQARTARKAASDMRKALDS